MPFNQGKLENAETPEWIQIEGTNAFEEKGIMLTWHISDIMKWASNKNFSKFPDVPFSVFLKIYVL